MHAGLPGLLPDPHPHRVGVREEQRAFDPQHLDPVHLGVLGMALDVRELARRPGHPAEDGYPRPRRPVQQHEHGDPDADEQPGQRVEDQHAEHCGDSGNEVRPSRHPQAGPEPPRVHAVERRQCRNVDELDHRCHDDRREGGLRQRLEQAGEEQQRDHRHGRHHQPGELRARAGGRVDGRLGEAAVHDHAARQARREVRAAEPEQLAVRIDVVVVSCGVVLRGPEALGEADEHHPDRPGRERTVVPGARVRQAERREPAADLPHDVQPLVAEVEQLDEQDPEQHRHQGAGHGGRHAPEPQHQRQRAGPDGERQPVVEPSAPPRPQAPGRSCRRRPRPRTASAAGRRRS